MDKLDEKHGFLSGVALKYIAIFAMLIDHIAWAFLPLESPLAQIMHTIGRLTAPIMCFMLAEGFHHTRNLKKYLLRMGIFAVISAFAFTFFEKGEFFPLANMGIIYTLFLGLLALAVWNSKLHVAVRYLLIIALCGLSLVGDWPVFGILFVLAFGINYGNFKKQSLMFSIIAIFMSTIMVAGTKPWYIAAFNFAVLLAIPLLRLYNGEKGRGGKFNKWVFYVFYPLHLVILGIIKFYIL